MIRNETYENGVIVKADCYDLNALAYTREEMGIVTVSRPMTTDEWLTYGPQPLDRLGAAMALLAATGVLPIEDAANIAGVTPSALVTEVEGWAAAGGG